MLEPAIVTSSVDGSCEPSWITPIVTPLSSRSGGTAIPTVPFDSVIGSPWCGCGNACVPIVTAIVAVSSSGATGGSVVDLQMFVFVADPEISTWTSGTVVVVVGPSVVVVVGATVVVVVVGATVVVVVVGAAVVVVVAWVVVVVGATVVVVVGATVVVVVVGAAVVVVVAAAVVVVVVAPGAVVVVVPGAVVVVVVAAAVVVVVVSATVVVVVVSGAVVVVVVSGAAWTLIVISTVAGTLHVAAMDVNGGAAPSATVEVRTFSKMWMTDPAAPAVAWIERSGVPNTPGAIGPTVAKPIVSAAGNEWLSAVVTPSIVVGPEAVNDAWSNVAPCTWYAVDRLEYEWTVKAPSTLAGSAAEPPGHDTVNFEPASTTSGASTP